MVITRNTGSALRLTLVVGTALSLAACAHQPKPAYPTTSEAPAQRPPEPPRGPTGPSRPEPVTQNALPGSERDFTVNVGDRVYFDYDQYSVRNDAAPLLDAQADWLKRYPAVQVRIEGNADERGTEEYNLALGARRANAVREYLVAHGVAAGRITTVSFGKEKPIDPGVGEVAESHNRNGHTAIVSGARMQ
ncbi:MAG TPA: peptidoglycan-associated lipoprotein Pal [Phenylobacterium sp.]|jgi:peptidoglycan-associated lipoprotein|uniref:peptidoglycan-associated lipoprotein Pal n=1 Tax=Phenylobacterium sp. TaxID=1871053 RepID=UPI002BD430BA|nr:peptidoglycan-associated lipoprotein Pal [Phenylobacterium sp.]HXA38452.1 peptidoglycan-associated lipoprotein Pal [Phenylobacterium sp.]